MKQKKCLIAGLPESGKSTYLGALWYTINYHKDKDKMQLKAALNNPPENVEQLMSLSTKWVNVEDMDRTSNDVPENITFNMTDGTEEFTLNVPDFRGESIRQLITRNQPKSFDEWIEKGDTLLYMISDIDSGVFADDFQKDKDEEEQAEGNDEIPKFEIEKMTPAALNMLILRFFYERCKFRKVVICLSAWDKVIKESERTNPKEYLKEKSPALFNFIEYHFPTADIYGLSAQGESYDYETVPETGEKRVKADCKKRLQSKTMNGERAYIVEGTEKDNDITKPIAALLK